jgi:hypothetical protein
VTKEVIRVVLFEFRIGTIQNRRAITIKKDILKMESISGRRCYRWLLVFKIVLYNCVIKVNK